LEFVVIVVVVVGLGREGGGREEWRPVDGVGVCEGVGGVDVVG
jgi:hypothetical protein